MPFLLPTEAKSVCVLEENTRHLGDESSAASFLNGLTKVQGMHQGHILPPLHQEVFSISSITFLHDTFVLCSAFFFLFKIFNFIVTRILNMIFKGKILD